MRLEAYLANSALDYRWHTPVIFVGICQAVAWATTQHVPKDEAINVDEPTASPDGPGSLMGTALAAADLQAPKRSGG